jgi:hypothetical protein
VVVCGRAGGWNETESGDMRTDTWVYRLLVALSGITVVLVVAYIVLAQDNRSIQAEVNQRQQFINQSIQLGRVNEALIRALASTATANGDEKIRDLLAQNGITINPATGAPVASGTLTDKGAALASPTTAGTGR